MTFVPPLPAATLKQARRAWERGESIGVVRLIVGCKTDGGAYRIVKRWPRPRAVSLKLMGHRRREHPTEENTQPLVTASDRCSPSSGRSAAQVSSPGATGADNHRRDDEADDQEPLE